LTKGVSARRRGRLARISTGHERKDVENRTTGGGASGKGEKKKGNLLEKGKDRQAKRTNKEEGGKVGLHLWNHLNCLQLRKIRKAYNESNGRSVGNVGEKPYWQLI